MPHADTVYRSSQFGGVSVEDLKEPDPYADGKAAKVWEYFIGDRKARTDSYKQILLDLLRKEGCKRILDAACGTGVDSIMLVEEGFEVVSVDASAQMLKYAIKERWNRRKEDAFDKWVIEEANWLSLYDDIEPFIGDGFDAVLCLGNSFSHLPDSCGDQREHKIAIGNFHKCLKPGGLLLIDHRNYDNILERGPAPVTKNFYYNGNHTVDIITSVLYVSGIARVITREYLMDVDNAKTKFRFSFYPHRVKRFNEVLEEIFDVNKHTLFGDFKQLEENSNPSYYIHIIQKKGLTQISK